MLVLRLHATKHKLFSFVFFDCLQQYVVVQKKIQSNWNNEKKTVGDSYILKQNKKKIPFLIGDFCVLPFLLV
jgi:hypothetical protein